jgi:hypothetical protein
VGIVPVARLVRRGRRLGELLCGVVHGLSLLRQFSLVGKKVEGNGSVFDRPPSVV